LYAANTLAIVILVFALYFPRHRRRDLVVAYLGVNVGVLAVSTALADSTVGVGLGLGLFGVLSIIRLRSDELAQHEVAYYFSALALGLLSGLINSPSWITVALMAAIVLVMFIGDHPRLLSGYRRQLVVLDRAFVDQTELTVHVQQRLGMRVYGVTVQRVDLVDDTTWVEVRYRVPPALSARRAEPRSSRLDRAPAPAR
jgi:hypothetical protein